MDVKVPFPPGGAGGYLHSLTISLLLFPQSEDSAHWRSVSRYGGEANGREVGIEQNVLVRLDAREGEESAVKEALREVAGGSEWFARRGGAGEGVKIEGEEREVPPLRSG